MKYLYSLLLFLSCAVVLPAQEKAAEVYQWPVEGKQAGEGTFREMANSLFKCHIPMVRIVSDEYVSDAFPKGRGVIPHLNIPISYEEIAVDGNLLYTKTLELIKNGIYL